MLNGKSAFMSAVGPSTVGLSVEIIGDSEDSDEDANETPICDGFTSRATMSRVGS
jgi:hypothetical protein